MEIKKQALKNMLEDAFSQGCNYGFGIDHTEDIQKQVKQGFFEFLQGFYEFNLISKCKYCGNYFVLDGASKYCDRSIPGSKKTCREIGATLNYQKKTFDNPVAKLYNREYKKRNARIRYGMMSKNDFKYWSQEARKQRDLCIQDKISFEEFQQWLEGENNNGK